MTNKIPANILEGRAAWEVRFWSKVDKAVGGDGCWIWRGTLTDLGYSSFAILEGDYLGHRLSYELVKGKISEGLTLDHLCRNRACVNPDHLEPVSLKENVNRGNSPWGINSRKVFCSRGHRLSGNNLVMTKAGYRDCRECRKIRKLGGRNT